MTESGIKYSIVVPVFNAVNMLERLIHDIALFIEPIGKFEIILVDDCSSDGSWALLKQLKAKHSFLKIYRLSNNFGQAATTLCGIDRSAGEVIITIDDDLQYPASEIPHMIRFYHENQYPMVLGIARKKQHSRRYLLATVLVRLLFWLRPSGHLNGRNISSSFRIFSAMLKKAVNHYGQKSGSIHLANHLLSPRFVGRLEVDHQPDSSGKKSGYSFRKRLNHFTDLLMVFNKDPLSWVLWPAILLMIVALTGFAIPFLGIATDWLNHLILYLLPGVGAILLLSIMIVGKYVGHIRIHQLGMPPYLILEAYE
ncbi:MAG: glycosyltransferase [Roseivirga sp.]|nr:glycosyltransferase [Roseivirga sp.]